MTLIAPPGQKFKPPLEKDVQARCVKLLKLTGWTVYGMSQYRASHVAVGVADLFALHPRLGSLWWETKPPVASWTDDAGVRVLFNPFKPETWRPRRLSPEQETFRRNLIAAGQRHGWGTDRSLEALLIELGAGKRVGAGVFQPMRQW